MVTVGENVAGDDPYLPVEEVAERLGLPLSVLLHRVEAGDVPSQRTETDDGVRYALRLSDLGIERDDAELLGTTAEQPREAPLESGIVFQGAQGDEPVLRPVRRREPQRPPPWLVQGRGHRADTAGQDEGERRHEDLPGPGGDDTPAGLAVLLHGASASSPELGSHTDAAVAELAVPPPARAPLGLLDAGLHGPLADLATMSLDARELVAGLLDRWERSMEQRIYTEQRQRFQAELVSRQGMVKELEMELQAARAEHAAVQAAKDRELARKERELADRERELAETHRRAEEAERRASTPATRLLGWWGRRNG